MYLLAKALHVFAAGTLVGSLLARSILIGLAAGRDRPAGLQPLLQAALRWDSRIATPALATAWVAGFAMAADAGWLGSGWLLVKLVPVAAVTCLHLLSSQMLERLAAGGTGWPWLQRRMPAIILAAFAAIVFLAVVTPG